MLKPLPQPHVQRHYISRRGWLRAGVLGANDGIISIASLMYGVANASQSQQLLFLTGCAGLISGALSMAAGEYVSVSSQSDAEAADLRMEAKSLDQHPRQELEELTEIYRARGVTTAVAREVAVQLTQHDALEAHARDEIGISASVRARPMVAALASLLSFSIGGVVPVLVAVAAEPAHTRTALLAATLFALALLGAISSKLGGAPPRRAMLRVMSWGLAAMLVTGWFGQLIGVSVPLG